MGQIKPLRAGLADMGLAADFASAPVMVEAGNSVLRAEGIIGFG